jgi:hypothetical protein
VELKCTWGRLANIQRWQTERMLKAGADVRVVKGLDQVKSFIAEVFGHEVSAAWLSGLRIGAHR